MRNNIFYAIVFGFTLGIFFRSFFEWGYFFVALFIFLALIIFVSSFLFHNIKNIIVLISIFILTFGLGIFRFHVSDIKPPLYLEQQIGSSIELQGIIVDEPDQRESNTKLTVEIDKKVRVLITTKTYPEFQYGDKIKFSGKFQKPSNFITDIGKEFDYINYLAKDKIYYQVFYPKIEFISEGRGNFIKRNLFALKHSFLGSISKLISDPEASLMGGLLLGTKQALGGELQDDFIKVGIIHIVVLSGYNVTIVAESLLRFFSAFLRRSVAISIGVISIILFAIITGAGATIVRASIMALLVLFARITGRTYDITRALFLAGFLMLIHNPWILVFDISFQLSFLATIGLIFLAPKIIKYIRFLPKTLGLRDILSATIAVQLFLLPFILYKMGTLSIVSPIVNLLILPLIPLTMLFGFLAGIFNFITVVIATPFAWIAYIFLHYEISLSQAFANLSFASITAKSFPLIFVIIIYLMIFYYLIKTNNSKAKNIKTQRFG